MKTGTNKEVTVLNRLRKIVFARFVLLMLCTTYVLTAAFPVCDYLKSGKFIEICSGADIKLVQIEDKGGDIPSKHQAVKNCSYCMLRSLAAIEPAESVLVTINWEWKRSTNPFWISERIKPVLHLSSPTNPRAPPVAI